MEQRKPRVMREGESVTLQPGESAKFEMRFPQLPPHIELAAIEGRVDFKLGRVERKGRQWCARLEVLLDGKRADLDETLYVTVDAVGSPWWSRFILNPILDLVAAGASFAAAVFFWLRFRHSANVGFLDGAAVGIWLVSTGCWLKALWYELSFRRRWGRP